VTRLTVIVCSRDAAATLGSCLASVQPLAASDELLVMVGPSRDDTLDVARAAARVGRVVEQCSVGLAEARNEALALASGDLIAWCDADDRWTADSLAVRLAALESSGARSVVGHLVRERVDDAALPAAIADDLGRRRPGFTPGALLAWRDVYDRVGPFDPSLGAGTDAEWFTRGRALGAGPIVIDDVVLTKGARADSLSADLASYRRQMLAVARRHVAGRRHTDRSDAADVSSPPPSHT
jgi:glycosyltransferase involved in cell wall biosynthesis